MNGIWNCYFGVNGSQQKEMGMLTIWCSERVWRNVISNK